MFRPAWLAVAVLAVAHVVLSHLVTPRGAEARTYVFTPLVDVVPGGVPLTAGEAAELSAEAKNRVDARDIQKAYARMGSNISLDDLLDGVEVLEASGPALTEGQRARVRAVLEGAKADHAAVLAVQAEILDLEAELGREAEAVLAALPEESRARVLARAGSSAAGGRTPGGGPPGPGQGAYPGRHDGPGPTPGGGPSGPAQGPTSVGGPPGPAPGAAPGGPQPGPAGGAP